MSQSKIHNDIYVPSQTWTYHNQEASEEELKASYDDDIIDTYASRTVNLPASQTILLSLGSGAHIGDHLASLP